MEGFVLRLSVAMVCVAAVLAPLALEAQVANAKAASFEVTVVKPARPDADGEDWDSHEGMTEIKNYPVVKLIRAAYGLKSVSQVVGGPDWVRTLRVDVTAKVDAEEFKRLQSLREEEYTAEFGALLQGLLVERFGLRASRSTRTMPVMALERVSSTGLGPALQPVAAGPDGRPVGGSHSSRNGGHWEVGGESMENIASLLSARYEMGSRVVVDRTGTPGYFAFKLDYSPDHGTGVAPDATLPGLVDAVRQELGLKLVKTDSDLPVVVIESAQKPEFD